MPPAGFAVLFLELQYAQPFSDSVLGRVKRCWIEPLRRIHAVFWLFFFRKLEIVHDSTLFPCDLDRACPLKLFRAIVRLNANPSDFLPWLGA